MNESTKDTATSTAHVNGVLTAMGYDIVGGSVHHNRFKDGFRIQKATEQYGAIPVTVTSRRRTYDVQAEINKIVIEFAKRGLEIHDISVDDNNKFGSFTVRKAFNKGKTADGKGIVRINGRYWFIHLRSSVVWAVLTDDDNTDLRTVEVESELHNKYPFQIVAEMRRNVRIPGQRMLHWSVTINGKKHSEHAGLTAAKADVVQTILEK